MRVIDVASKHPVVIRPETTIGQAAALMDETGVECLVVTEKDRVVGVVTDRDIALRGNAMRASHNLRVHAVMTASVVTLPADVDLIQAYEVFNKSQLRRLPVVRGHQVVGMVSLDDLMSYSLERMSDLVQTIQHDIILPHRESPQLART